MDCATCAVVVYRRKLKHQKIMVNSVAPTPAAAMIAGSPKRPSTAVSTMPINGVAMEASITGTAK
jgi:hypothetical protein